MQIVDLMIVIPPVVALWNKHAGTEMPYKPFTEESFKQTFIDNPILAMREHL